MDFALVLDIIVVVILLISCVVAFLRGFVREVLTILGLGGAALTALVVGPKLAPGIEGWLTGGLPEDSEQQLWGFIPYDIGAMVFAYIGLFIITLIVLSIISHYIAKSVHAVGLGAIDRSLGVVFGVVRGLILIGLLYMPFHILMEQKDKDDWFGTSHTFMYVEQTSEIMAGFMPESWTREADEEGTTEETTDEELDPLKDLTGENDADMVGTEESVIDTESPAEEKTMEDRAIDVLIDNQDKIKDLIQGNSTNE